MNRRQQPAFPLVPAFAQGRAQASRARGSAAWRSSRSCLAALLLAAAAPAWSQATGTPPAALQDDAANAEVLVVERGTHRFFRELGAVARVAVGDPAIADVNLVNRQQLLIAGKSLGVTSLLLWRDARGQPTQYRVNVVPPRDPAAAAAPIDPELRDAVIRPAQGLSGRLPNLAAHRRARQQAQAGAEAPVADSSQIELETQVLTEVKIADVSRRSAQQFGFNFGKIGGGGTLPNTQIGVSAPGSVPTVPSFENPAVPLGEAFNLLIGDPSRRIGGVLSMLERKGLAQVLAEPSLLATSGQTASYLVGGEFPVPVNQGGSAAGSISVQFREFGVRLSLTPTVLSRDRISLKVAPEVSDLDFSNAVQIGGVLTPGLRVRRTDTTIELGDGESFVISGLISSSTEDNIDKVPFLGDIPVLGAFFRSSRVGREARELIMVVTPHLVRPLARQAQLPKLPGERERRRNPSAVETLFLETGDFSTGFSN